MVQQQIGREPVPVGEPVDRDDTLDLVEPAGQVPCGARGTGDRDATDLRELAGSDGVAVDEEPWQVALSPAEQRDLGRGAGRTARGTAGST